MPRFSGAFGRRKSVADNLENVDLNAPAQPSFKVLERNTHTNTRSFDGGAKMTMPKPAQHTLLRPTQDPHEDNMFADFKTSRGLSNTTQATSTDNSSRHSNASTAPSSADMHANTSPVEARQANKATTPAEADGPARGPSTKSISASLFKASRTWSFGGQKKQSIPPPRDEPAVPDLPPMLTIQTGSTSVPTEPIKSPASPSSPEQKKALDLGGDFGAMFSSRGLETVRETASNPRSLTGGRTNTMPASMSEPLSPSDSTPTATYPTEYKKSTPSPVLDEDAKLLRDSFAAMKFLDNPHSGSGNAHGLSATESFYSRQPRDDPIVRKPVTIAESFAKDKEDNLFEGRTYSFARNNNRYISQRTAHPPRNKVMTPAQFEQYKQDKERQGMTAKTTGPVPSGGRALPPLPPKAEEDDEDEINYDDDEDEAEKSRQQVKQRRKQEAHMAVYRQQMMKVTGEHAVPPIAPARPSLPATMSAPQLSTMKTPANPANPTSGVSDEDEDDEVPLAILQAHGFPAKNRPPTRLSASGSNPNLRNSYQPSVSRPQSVMGDASANSANRRASTLPAFARGLPQDPFVGASIHKPAVRESLSFHEGPRNGGQSSLHPGGLVGVIANEERSRAMRRGSPNIDAGRPLPPNMYQQAGPGGFDPVTGIPHQMMYGQSGMNGMGGGNIMPGMHPGEQAQQQMTQQMQQFMQMQMQFMQMMAMNQNQPNHQGMPQMPQMPQMPNNPYPMQQQQGGYAATQSMGNLSSRQSVMGVEPMMDRFDPNMRTMSMVQPPPQFMGHHPGYAGSTHGSISGGMGYAPSIAPSERSNIGLPGRYRPVSHVATPSPKLSQHSDSSNTVSGGLGAGLAISDANKSRSSLNVSRKASDGSDDDDESGWAAMKAKRDKKRSMWHRKKPLSGDLTNEQLAGI
ncbi:hypothetical protein LMH87_007187 [Akanthomyces muscarius]|uniref:Uncharacterized protein n=1 Tax=Akanthomyces muscarius TaxID=2231603 RepID=A0A9W8QSA5_AKAMU|nr:hypothetical protein LMH87_007187 [Akanthomyces muscarius]KAJ4165559.1 hypothetical protein LMH87_007187 [Akanthomyces muscarius]